MPIYEYRCEKCGERVEVLVRGGGATPHCPHCGSPLLTKLISAPHLLHGPQPSGGRTCCGLGERCETPPCSDSGACRRDRR